jgi:hypothetical protein
MTILNSPPPRSASFLQDDKHIGQIWSGWFRNLFNVLRPGKTEDVVVAGITLHFVNGVYTGHE